MEFILKRVREILSLQGQNNIFFIDYRFYQRRFTVLEEEYDLWGLISSFLSFQ